MVGGQPRQLLQGMVFGPLMSVTGRRRMALLSAGTHRDGLLVLNRLIEARKVVPVIDSRFSFTGLPEAMRYLGKGHARGKIVVSLG
jgi:NADPH:quinone reductase-like Zn-dependent oxidoreductase